MKLDPDGPTLQALDRWVLLRRAEALAEALPDSRRARVAALRKAGDRRRAAALGEHGIPALILARAAIPLYLEAAVTARGDELPPRDPSLATLWQLYDGIAERALLPWLPLSLETARAVTIAGATPEEDLAAHGEAGIDAALELGAFLAGRLDARTPGRIRLERRVRQTFLIIGALFLLGRAATHLVRSRNVALHAAVVASSRRPECGPPSDLTNGKVEEAVAFCTKDEPDPWVQIDLGAPHRLSQVTLLNSPDHLDDSLPLRVETSADGGNWATGAMATMHFTPTEPAVVAFSAREARFVRLHGRGGGAIYLTEVEAR